MVFLFALNLSACGHNHIFVHSLAIEKRKRVARDITYTAATHARHVHGNTDLERNVKRKCPHQLATNATKCKKVFHTYLTHITDLVKMIAFITVFL